MPHTHRPPLEKQKLKGQTMISCHHRHPRCARYTHRLSHPQPLTARLAGSRLVRLVVAYSFLLGQVVFAAPQGEQVVAGQADFQRSGDVTQITTSHQAIINYSSFDIHSHETVRFVQPNEMSRVLNRVNSPNPTEIAGRLQANGQVYIVNPAGIYFANGALVDVGGIYAAAASISNTDFLSNVDHFTDVSGSVVNHGTIQGGFAHLIGKHVANYGTIVADNRGLITMVSGDDVLLGQVRDHWLVRLKGAAADAQNNDADNSDAGSELPGVTNAGKIEAKKGRVRLAAGDLISLALQDTSTIQADTIEAEGGNGSLVEVSGTLDASNTTPGEIGGTVHVLGDKVALYGAQIDASGDAGGGEVLIGGDYQGNGVVRNATRTLVDADTVIRADALTHGKGGRVIVWANQITGYAGAISARGGTLGGDGGFAEVSGKEGLLFQGTADLTAPLGSLGTLLLDPQDITIKAFDDSTTFTTDLPDADPVDNRILIDFNMSPAEMFLLNTTVQTALNSANVELQATRDIFVNAEIAPTSGANDLTLRARRHIEINAPITLNGGDLIAIANDNGTGGGNITVAAGTAFRSTIDTNGGDLTLQIKGGGVNNSITLGQSAIVTHADTITIDAGQGSIFGPTSSGPVGSPLSFVPGGGGMINQLNLTASQISDASGSSSLDFIDVKNLTVTHTGSGEVVLNEVPFADLSALNNVTIDVSHPDAAGPVELDFAERPLVIVESGTDLKALNLPDFFVGTRIPLLLDSALTLTLDAGNKTLQQTAESDPIQAERQVTINANSVFLDNPNNDFSTLAFNTTGSVSVADPNNLNLDNSTIGSELEVAAQNIFVNGALSINGSDESVMTAQRHIEINAPITLNGGNFTATANDNGTGGGSITVAASQTINTQGGDLTLEIKDGGINDTISLGLAAIFIDANTVEIDAGAGKILVPDGTITPFLRTGGSTATINQLNLTASQISDESGTGSFAFGGAENLTVVDTGSGAILLKEVGIVETSTTTLFSPLTDVIIDVSDPAAAGRVELEMEGAVGPPAAISQRTLFILDNGTDLGTLALGEVGLTLHDDFTFTLDAGTKAIQQAVVASGVVGDAAFQTERPVTINAGSITLDGANGVFDNDFRDTLTLTTTQAGGASGNVTVGNTGPLVFGGDLTANVAGALTLTGAGVTIDSPLDVGGGLILDGTTGQVTVNQALESTGTLEIDGTGIVINNNLTATTAIDLDSTSGNLNFLGAPTLDAPTIALRATNGGTINASTPAFVSGTGSPTAFTFEQDGAVNASALPGNNRFTNGGLAGLDYTVKSTTGKVTIGSADSGRFTGMDLILEGANIDLSGGLALGSGSLTANTNSGAGDITFTGPTASVTTEAGQSYTGNLVFDADTTLTDTSGSALTIGGSVGGSRSLTLDILGETTFTQPVALGGSIQQSAVTGKLVFEDELILQSFETSSFQDVEFQDNAAFLGGTNIFNGQVTFNNQTAIGPLEMISEGELVFEGPVELAGGATSISTANEAITFNGTVSGAQALTIDSGTAQTTFANDIGSDANRLQSLGLIADEITISQDIFVSDFVTLTPATTDRSVAIGVDPESDPDPDRLVFTNAELGRIDAPGGLVIGSTDTGNIAIEGAVTFHDPVQILASGGGSITVDGPITGVDDVSITLTGPGASGVVLNADIITQGNRITIDGNALLGGAPAIRLDTTQLGDGFEQGADITVAGSIDNLPGSTESSLTLTAGTDGVIDLQGNVGQSAALGDVELEASVIQSHSVTTTGDQAYTAGTIMSNDLGSGAENSYTSTGSGDILFDGAVELARDTQVINQSGSVGFKETVAGVGHLALEAAGGGIVLGGAVEVGSVSADTSGGGGLAETGGDITVHDITTAGGDIVLQVNPGMTDGSRQGMLPNALLRINSTLITNGGNVQLNPNGRPATSSVATIIGNDDTQFITNGGSFSMGLNEKFSALGDLSINVGGGVASIGDLSAAGNITVSANTVNFNLRPEAPVLLANGGLGSDQGLDIVSGGSVNLNALTLNPISPSSTTLSPDARTVVLASALGPQSVNLSVNTLIPTGGFGIAGLAAGETVSVVLDGGMVFDGTVGRLLTSSIAIFSLSLGDLTSLFSFLVPTDDELAGTEDQTGLEQSEKEMLRMMGVSAEDLDLAALLEILLHNHSKVINDLMSPEIEGLRTTTDRMLTPVVHAALRLYLSLYRDREVDDHGRVVLRPRSAQVKALLTEAWIGYKTAGRELGPIGFEQYLRVSYDHEEALDCVVKLRSLFKHLALMGLTPLELNSVKTVLLKREGIIPDGMTQKEFERLILSPKPRVTVVPGGGPVGDVEPGDQIGLTHPDQPDGVAEVGLGLGLTQANP